MPIECRLLIRPLAYAPAPSAFSQLYDYLSHIHYANICYQTTCPDELAADLFRQFYIFLGTDIPGWYPHFRTHHQQISQCAGRTPAQADYLLLGGVFAEHVQAILGSVHVAVQSCPLPVDR